MHCSICLDLQRRKRRKGSLSSLVQFKEAQYLTGHGISKGPWPWQWSCQLWNYSFSSTLGKGGSGPSCCSMDHLGAHFFFEDYPKELQITPTTTFPLLSSCTRARPYPSERQVGPNCLHPFSGRVNFKIWFLGVWQSNPVTQRWQKAKLSYSSVTAPSGVLVQDTASLTLGELRWPHD